MLASKETIDWAAEAERLGVQLKSREKATALFFAELLDGESVPLGELCRIIRSVRQSVREGGEESVNDWVEGMARQLATYLLAGEPSPYRSEDVKDDGL